MAPTGRYSRQPFYAYPGDPPPLLLSQQNHRRLPRLATVPATFNRSRAVSYPPSFVSHPSGSQSITCGYMNGRPNHNAHWLTQELCDTSGSDSISWGIMGDSFSAAYGLEILATAVQLVIGPIEQPREVTPETLHVLLLRAVYTKELYRRMLRFRGVEAQNILDGLQHVCPARHCICEIAHLRNRYSTQTPWLLPRMIDEASSKLSKDCQDTVNCIPWR